MVIVTLICLPAARDPRCAQCHAAESLRQSETRMAHALVRTDRCQRSRCSLPIAGSSWDCLVGVQSISDTNNNTLTFSPNGITSSTGKGANFQRDAQNRIL